MGRLKYIRIRNYRSINETITIRVPDASPIVLVGENNAGKSNIARAIDLVLREAWAGSHEPDDHEFYNHDRSNVPMIIGVDLDGVTHTHTSLGVNVPVETLYYQYPHGDAKEPAFRVRFSQGSDWRANNDIREQCVCIYIGADRRLSYQLSYVSRYTFLSRLMRVFHSALMGDVDRTRRLQEQFAGVRAIFGEVEEFTQFTERLQSQLSEFSKTLEYGLNIDFSAYDPSNYFHALRVQATQDGQLRTFDELGTGQEQLLALSFVQAYAESFHGAGGLVLLIEEPEAHLHPLAQQWLARKMQDLVRAGVQVVITTHSPAFVDIMSLEGLVEVRKISGATHVTQLNRSQLAHHCANTGAAGATAENVLPFYAAAATPEILSGLFASRIVLVEGPTEAHALPHYLTRSGYIPIEERTAIIPVHGVGQLAKWWRFFTAYGIPVYPIFDNDAGDDEDADGRRRMDLLKALGLQESEAAEVLSTHEWLVRDSYSVFGRDFETTMRTAFGADYEALEREASDNGLNGKQSKPLLARYVAERIALRPDTQAFEKFTLLGESIRCLSTPANTAPPAPE